MYIYVIHDNLNGKYYVGKTVSKSLKRYLSEKWCRARKEQKAAMPIIRAMQEFGVDNFSFDVLTTAENPCKLNELEKLWIIALDAKNPEIGYNVKSGGNSGPLGLELSEIHKQKIGLANKGRKPVGYIRTEEHRQQLRERMKGNKIGKKITPEIARQWKENETPEQRVIRGLGIKQAWANPEIREKILNAQKEERARRKERLRA